MLKTHYKNDEDKYLIMEPTGKLYLKICGSKMHSHKEGLGVLINRILKDLKGDQLDYFHKNIRI